MSKKPNRSKEQHYKKIIASQKKVIQKLSKQAGRGKKIKDHYEELELELEEELLTEEYIELPQNNKNTCPDCGRSLRITDLGIRKLYNCECGYRLVKKSSS